jgi:hypothetical protein
MKQRKMNKRMKNRDGKFSNAHQPRTMSEMISELGAGFLGASDSMDEMQNRLNAVCSAWNLACAPPAVRERQLEQQRDSYLKFNPDTSPSELADIVKDLELLIERKLQMFPDDRRQIVGAKVVKVGTGHRIEVASATLE